MGTVVVSSNRIFLVILLCILDPVGPFGNTITELWGLSSADTECQFKCDNGQQAKANPHYVATSNGCGVPGMTQMPKMLNHIPSDKLEGCCEIHDICYGTCNVDKNDCDWMFQNCLNAIFGDLVNHTPGIVVEGCKTAAKMTYSAVTIMGCKHYHNAQKEACICVEMSNDDDL